jgi:hypothetical protein
MQYIFCIASHFGLKVHVWFQNRLNWSFNFDWNILWDSHFAEHQ